MRFILSIFKSLMRKKKKIQMSSLWKKLTSWDSKFQKERFGWKIKRQKKRQKKFKKRKKNNKREKKPYKRENKNNKKHKI